MLKATEPTIGVGQAERIGQLATSLTMSLSKWWDAITEKQASAARVGKEKFATECLKHEAAIGELIVRLTFAHQEAPINNSSALLELEYKRGTEISDLELLQLKIMLNMLEGAVRISERKWHCRGVIITVEYGVPGFGEAMYRECRQISARRGHRS